MKKSTRIATIAGAAAAIAIVAGVAVSVSGAASSESETSADRPVVMTEFPGINAADGDPQLPGMTELSPAAGTVAETAGPFDDRFEFSDLAFDGTAVSGAVLVTSDVSEVIELEVLAGFYDASGALLGTGSFALEDHEEGHTGPPEEFHTFDVPVPEEFAGTAVSAAVGVPVLVNE